MRFKILAQIILVIPTLFLLISCNESDDFSKIKVGMTYDEVEGILGKPSSISRGANELYYDINEIQYDLLQRLNLDTTEIILDSKRWFVPQQIRTVGNLIYVTWEYEDTKLDTFYVLLNNIEEHKDTTVNTYPVYYLGEDKVSKLIYDDSDGYLYRIPPKDKIVTKSEYETYINGMAKSKPVAKETKKKSSLLPKVVKKRIEYKKNVSVNIYEVRESIEKLYFEVEYKLCVIFDSSSGRVTESRYFPFYVRKLHSEIIKEE